MEGKQLKMGFHVETLSATRPSTFDRFVDWKRTKKVPLPSQYAGKGRTPWVTWGKDNSYPLFLNTLYEESPSQTGIINGKTYYMTAGGFQVVLDNPEDGEQKLLVEEFIANGPSQFTFKEVLFDQVFDGEMYNGFVIRGVWNEDGSRPKFLEQIDFDCIRTNKQESKYWYSNDWSQTTQSTLKTGFREIPRLDFTQRIGEFIIYIRKRGKKVNKGEENIYPKAPYNGCIKSLMTEVEHEAFDLYEVMNGFKAGRLVEIPNAQAETDDEKKNLADSIKEGATDRESAGSVMVVFTEGGDNKGIQIHTLTGDDLPDRYINVSKKTANTIIRGHSIVTPALFGIAVEGQLGTQQELEAGFEIIKKTYVGARQSWYNDIYTWVLRNLYGINGNMVMNPPPPLFGGSEQENEKGKALSSLAPNVSAKVMAVMTANELRDLAKLPALPGGDVLPGATQPTTVVNVGQQPVKTEEQHNCEEHVDEEFLARDPILKHFANVGRKRNSFIFAKSKAVPVECDSDWFKNTEAELLEAVKEEKLYFATFLTEMQKNVLSLIEQGQDSISIAKALTESMGKSISIQDVVDSYTQLAGKGMIKKDNVLSEKGRRYLDVTEVPIDNYEIRYSYELRPDAPRLIGESRSFCKELLKMDKLYLREEIDRIGAAVDRDVWHYRGGWYHNPAADQNTPYCRHYWVQHLVIKEK